MRLLKNVIPAKAGIHNHLILLDPCFRRDDKKGIFQQSLMRLVFAAFFIVLSAVSGAPALAKSAEERINDLEKQISSIQRTYLGNNADMANSLAQFNTIQGEFTSLKGAVETNQHLIESQRQDFQKTINALEHRLQSIEDRLDIFASQITSAIAKVAPAVAEEGKLYQKALDNVNRSEYLTAAADFQNFVRKYPKSTLAPTAQYWVGESCYSMRDYKRAIKEYQNFIQANPRHEKVPQAILNQGNSFYELGLLDESKPFYEKVMKDYPNSPEAAEADAKIKRLAGKQAQKSAASLAPAQNTALPSYPMETLEQQRSKYNQPSSPSQPQTSAPPKTENKTGRYIEF